MNDQEMVPPPPKGVPAADLRTSSDIRSRYQFRYTKQIIALDSPGISHPGLSNGRAECGIVCTRIRKKNNQVCIADVKKRVII